MSEQDVFQAAMRHCFWLFALKAAEFLSPTTKFDWGWPQYAMCHHLDEVRRGTIKRGIITIPPRSLKSTVASVAFPAFVLGHNPSAKIICVSYSSDLALDLARKCRTLMSSQFYASIFPNTQIGRERNAAGDFVTTARGHRIATSVGGTLTGRGGDIVIIDDFHKPDDVMSDAKRTSSLQWFDNTLYSRLDDKRTGAIVIVMQRLHVGDLVGHVLANERSR